MTSRAPLSGRLVLRCARDQMPLDHRRVLDPAHAGVAQPGQRRGARGEQLVQAVGGQAHGQHRLGAGALVTVQHPQVARLAVSRPATASTSASTSPRPRFSPWPAKGCRRCAASPASAMPGATICARSSVSGKPCSLLRTVNLPSRPSAARQQSFQRGGLLALRQGQQPRRGLFAHGPDHRHLRAVGRVRQRQQRQHAVVAEPLNGGALVRPFGVQVHHQSGVLVRHRLVLRPAASRSGEAAPSAPTNSSARMRARSPSGSRRWRSPRSGPRSRECRTGARPGSARARSRPIRRSRPVAAAPPARR